MAELEDAPSSGLGGNKSYRGANPLTRT